MTDALLEVLSPGLQTTVQDGGRPDLGHLGIPRGGAADAWSMAVANLLLGNAPDAAILECTLIGPELRVLGDVVVALAGADLGANVRPGGRRLAPGASHRLTAGEVVAFAGGDGSKGARVYLAVPGGIDVPLVLGSGSTCLVAGFGGLDGRALRVGDVLRAVGSTRAPAAGLRWPEGPEDPGPGDGALRVLAGPDATPDALTSLMNADWTVSHRSDRRGLRLDGPRLAPPGEAGERLTSGVVPGALQLPPDGMPIVLLCDAQPTGGYPALAVVISADLPLLGQLPPGAAVHFVGVDAPAARRASLARRVALAVGSRGLGRP